MFYSLAGLQNKESCPFEKSCSSLNFARGPKECTVLQETTRGDQ